MNLKVRNPYIRKHYSVCTEILFPYVRNHYSVRTEILFPYVRKNYSVRTEILVPGAKRRPGPPPRRRATLLRRCPGQPPCRPPRWQAPPMDAPAGGGRKERGGRAGVGRRHGPPSDLSQVVCYVSDLLDPEDRPRGSVTTSLGVT
jgi:hypothetical protein